MIIVRLCSKSGFSSKKVAKHHSQSIAKVSKAFKSHVQISHRTRWNKDVICIHCEFSIPFSAVQVFGFDLWSADFETVGTLCLARLASRMSHTMGSADTETKSLPAVFASISVRCFVILSPWSSHPRRRSVRGADLQDFGVRPDPGSTQA